MKHPFTSKVAWVALVLGLAVVLAPAAFAGGGAVSHSYAPAPLDAGSAVPNPDYLPGVVVHTYAPPPLDAGSAVPNPDYTKPVVSIDRSDGGGLGFWQELGLAVAGVLALALAFVAAIEVRRLGKRLAAT